MSDKSHGALEKKHDVLMHALAKLLSEELDPYGFCLLVFEFGTEGRLNYISNANREDMIATLKEAVATLEGRALPPSTTTQ